MSEIILARVVQTCAACPSQWDAWDVDGDYWYLRYRHGRGTVERQPGPYPAEGWTLDEPNISFDGEAAGMADGWISFEDFCREAGLNVHPGADIYLSEDAQ
jgi:hypothetical protein